MTAQEYLKSRVTKLKQAGVGTARLDALVLLEDATGKDRSWLLANPDYDVKGLTLHKLEKQIKRRIEHEPLAYIRGKTEFYGREFKINKHVLEPRPESETMIELLKELVDSRQLTVGSCIADIGTGSGAIGITAKLELTNASVLLTDIDQKCLEVAKKNAKKHNVNVEFLKGDLLEPLHIPSPNSYLLICNLPYVPDSHTLNEAAMNEPKIAIFGGPDGLDLYRRLFSQIATKSQFYRVDYVFTESLPFQHKGLAKIAKKAGFKQVEESDFIQVFIQT